MSKETDLEAGGSAASDEDAAWFAALRGHPSEGVRSPSAVEGLLLREAMLKWPPVVDPLPIHEPGRIARLSERARAEGLPDASGPDVGAWSGSERSRRPAGGQVSRWARIRAGGLGAGRASLALAAVLVLATSVWLARPLPPAVDEGVVRTAPDAIVVLRVRDPEVSRRELVDALTAEGIAVTRYTRLGRLGIDADLPKSLPPGVLGALGRQGVFLPTDGVLRVEYERSGP